MAIPASYIVAINPRIISPGGTDLEFNGLFLTKNVLIPTTAMVMEFTSADAVGEYFGFDSGEYEVASKYFLGYSNSFVKPKRLMYGARINADRAAYLRSGAYRGKLADLKAITNGGMIVKIDGAEHTIGGVDFSGAASFSDVASVLETKIAAAVTGTTVTFSAINNCFTIVSPTTGASSAMEFAKAPATGDDLSSLMLFTEATGAILSQGAVSMTETANMNALKAVTQNWVDFTTMWEATNAEHLAYAQWASNQGVDYLYIAWSKDAQLITPASTTSIADEFEAAEVEATCLVYDNIMVAVTLMASIGSIAWERYQGAINLAFKSVDGVAASVTSESIANLLDNKKANYVGKFATRNDDFVFLYKGQVFGKYKWIDTYINAVWIKNVLQVAIMNGISQAGRVPYNDRGYAMIQAWCMDPIQRGLNNGVIDVGVTLNNTQKAQVIQEVGEDISQYLYSNGFHLIVADPDPTARVTRATPDIYLYYCYGGSVDKIEVASTVLA